MRTTPSFNPVQPVPTGDEPRGRSVEPDLCADPSIDPHWEMLAEHFPCWQQGKPPAKLLVTSWSHAILKCVRAFFRQVGPRPAASDLEREQPSQPASCPRGIDRGPAASPATTGIGTTAASSSPSWPGSRAL